jgi:hypothetical protein
MNREQLNTPRELTAEELDMVFGGAVYIKYGNGGGGNDPQKRIFQGPRRGAREVS